jgi:hypothetical protein
MAATGEEPVAVDNADETGLHSPDTPTVSPARGDIGSLISIERLGLTNGEKQAANKICQPWKGKGQRQ